MDRNLDILGETFGNLTVVGYSHTQRNGSYWDCVCKCGNTKKVTKNHLMTGHTKSCGCLRPQVITKHGDHKERLYSIWSGMKRRCLNKSANDYYKYGERGISVHEEWMEYPLFKKWALENGYSDDLTLERLDFNGNYEPENCKWIPLEEQLKNTRRNVFITFEGETKVLSDWARHFDINYQTLKGRYWRGDGEKSYLGKQGSHLNGWLFLMDLKEVHR
ncbi:hypothetical protein ACT7CZ_02735 [Bacillus cereus]